MRPDIAAIRARADAATKGPWEVADAMTPPSRDHVADCGGDNYVCPVDDGSLQECDVDARFIAAARTDVPALCNRVEALEAALEEAEDALTQAAVDIAQGPTRMLQREWENLVIGVIQAARDKARAALEGE